MFLSLLSVKYPKTVLLFISHILILVSINCSRDRGLSTLTKVGADALFYSKLFHTFNLHDYLHIAQAHHHADSSSLRSAITLKTTTTKLAMSKLAMSKLAG
jgi:hypothetical protein